LSNKMRDKMTKVVMEEKKGEMVTIKVDRADRE